MANVDIRVGKKDSTFFSANPTLVLKNGQLIYNETTSELFIGDGVTQLSSLVAINGASYTFTNGLTESGSTAKLGGTLTEVTNIDGNFAFLIGENTALNEYSIKVGDLASMYSNMYLDYSSNSIRGIDVINNIVSRLTANAEAGVVNSVNVNGVISSLFIYINQQSINNNGTNNILVLTDEISQKGAVYASDYSANFTPESLVSKRYVDTNIVQVDTSTIGSAINGATDATPNDTDLVMSVESSVAKKNTWTQIKAFLKTYFDVFYTAKQSQLNSGGTITIGTFGGSGTNNDIRVSAANWYVQSSTSNYSTSTDTDFLDIALSSAGLQRYIGFYGTTSNTITKVEGTESEYAAVPTQPANTALIGYILVTDSAAGTAPDLSPYALINPRVLSITSSAAPTYDISQYDELYITALAADVNLSTNMSGTVGHSKQFIIHIKDNGVARLITMGTKFAAKYAALPTTTTAGKWMSIGCKRNSNTSKFDVWVVSQEA